MAADRQRHTPRFVSPLGHCDDCGEPLRWEPCLNCRDLRDLRREGVLGER